VVGLFLSIDGAGAIRITKVIFYIFFEIFQTLVMWLGPNVAKSNFMQIILIALSIEHK